MDPSILYHLKTKHLLLPCIINAVDDNCQNNKIILLTCQRVVMVHIVVSYWVELAVRYRNSLVVSLSLHEVHLCPLARQQVMYLDASTLRIPLVVTVINHFQVFKRQCYFLPQVRLDFVDPICGCKVIQPLWMMT